MTTGGSSTCGTVDERLAGLSVSSGDSFAPFDDVGGIHHPSAAAASDEEYNTDDDDGEDSSSVITLENVDADNESSAVRIDVCSGIMLDFTVDPLAASDRRLFPSHRVVNNILTGCSDAGSRPAVGNEGSRDSSRDDDEDLEFNFVKTRRGKLCRSTSLKASNKKGGGGDASATSTDCPQTKKAVRFADALGLDLESVRHILDNSGDRLPPFMFMRTRRPAARRVKLQSLFAEPGSSSDFFWRIQEKKVALEESSLDETQMAVSGVVRVANIAYEKQVRIRYTTDNWKTKQKIDASYLPPGVSNPRYDGGLTDAFTFRLQLPDEFATSGGLLQFSVRFVAGGTMKFWDNNFGTNYCVECTPVAEPAASTASTTMTSSRSRSST